MALKLNIAENMNALPGSGPSGVNCPASCCTCARESPSALGQYQQTVFHHSMTEAHEIRAESTQNNHTELGDNPEPKHQRETGGHCFVDHSTRIHPEGKQQCYALLLCDLAGTGKTGCDEFLCPR